MYIHTFAYLHRYINRLSQHSSGDERRGTSSQVHNSLMVLMHYNNILY